jgi:serine/threonine protein kinase
MVDRLNAALSGWYRIDELVGRGGMAAVYRATDLRHDRVVAIKVMNVEFTETVGRERFLREIRVTAGLTHPHILPLYDSGDVDGRRRRSGSRRYGAPLALARVVLATQRCALPVAPSARARAGVGQRREVSPAARSLTGWHHVGV